MIKKPGFSAKEWMAGAGLFMAALAVSCAPHRGSSPPKALQQPPAASQEAAKMPVVNPESRRARYYSDLGPDSIDVTNYPIRQRDNYRVYAQTCSRCHTLARSINSPAVSRSFWEFYILGRRGINPINKKSVITPQERQAILDFLDYDSRVRKIQHADVFNAQTKELKRRYEAFLQKRMRALQQSQQPVILNPAGR